MFSLTTILYNALWWPGSAQEIIVDHYHRAWIGGGKSSRVRVLKGQKSNYLKLGLIVTTLSTKSDCNQALDSKRYYLSKETSLKHELKFSEAVHDSCFVLCWGASRLRLVLQLVIYCLGCILSLVADDSANLCLHKTPNGCGPRHLEFSQCCNSSLWSARV